MTREEKDKLIELSDLNREDNIKYISSEAQGIAITLDSDTYASTLCKLERAYICGRRKSEMCIDELKEENNKLLDVISNYEVKVADLEQQIKKMKCDVKQEQSYWNSGEMQYRLFQRLLDKWEIKENE